MRKLLLLLAALLPGQSWASYNYFATDNLQSQNNSAPTWYMNGSTANSASGLIVTAASGGSYIFKNNAPDGTNQYEVAATLNLPTSGGNYVLYLEASSNAVLGSTSTASFYAFAIQNPTFANGGCTATATLYKVVSGSVSQISSTTVPCAGSIVYHAVLGNDGKLRFWVNNVEYLSWTDASPLTGTGGVGGYGMPTGNSISLVQIGPCDRTAPSPVDAASVQTYPLSTRLDLRTAGSADDANGVGVNGYNWFRDGVAVATTQTPVWSDVSVTGGSSHTYGVQPFDHHGNFAPTTNFTVAVPANATIDARQVGVRPTGSYWGGMGEQIDTRSGNLNFSVPLIKALSRGWSVPISLSYNSQNWRLDSAGTPWQLGDDVGFGFGWQMQIGSLTPFSSNYFTVQFYQFSDASGATYRLDQNNNGIWTSKESVYVTYDANAQRLYFNNGSFWVLGCTSAGTEGDAGTMYPTLLQDSNGNQITVQYAAGKGVTWLNSSARITTIQDVRRGTNPTGAATFLFTYNNDPTPHLSAIANAINSQDSFGFTYSAPTTLASPFGNAGTFDSVSFLQSTSNNATNLTTTFTYDSAHAGELVQVMFPLGGHIRWQYGNAAYAQTTVREVVNRYLLWDTNIGERSYVFSSTTGSGNLLPASRQVIDSQANAVKQWQFGQTQNAAYGLLTGYTEGAPGQAALRSTAYTWTQDPAGNNYIGRLQTTSDPGQSYAVTKQVDQTVDAYGNVTQTKLYDYTDLANPAKTYNTTYLTSANGANYLSLYIRNRVASRTVTDRNNVTTTLKTNTYDQYPNGITATANIQQHDTQNYGPGYLTRGNVYGETTPWLSWHSNYDQTGTALWTGKDLNPSHYVSRVTSTATNYAAPDQITTGNALNTGLSWSSSLQQAGQTGANGESVTVQYDQSDRPQRVSSPYGAQTIYGYSVSAPQITATTNNHWSKTYLDGLGGWPA